MVDEFEVGFIGLSTALTLGLIEWRWTELSPRRLFGSIATLAVAAAVLWLAHLNIAGDSTDFIDAMLGVFGALGILEIGGMLPA